MKAAGEAEGKAAVTISTIKDTVRGDDPEDYTVSIPNSKISYSNGELHGYANIKLSNDKTYLTKINMDGTQAYNAGAASVTQRTAIDVGYVVYSGGQTNYSRVSITYNDGNFTQLPIENAFSIGYNYGYNQGLADGGGGDLPSYAEGIITSVDQERQIVYGSININGTDIRVGLYA